MKGGLRVSNLLVSNPFGLPEKRYLMGAEVELVLPISVVAAGQMLNVTAVTLADRLQLGFLGIPGAVPHIEKLAAYTVDAFEQLKLAIAIATAPSPPQKRRPAAPRRIVPHSAQVHRAGKRAAIGWRRETHGGTKLRLRLDRRRLRVRWQRQRAAARREGLQGRCAGARAALSRRGFREDVVESAQVHLGADSWLARRVPPHALQGRLHCERLRRRRRQPRLREHALPCRAGVLHASSVGRPRGLGGSAQAALRHGRAHARRADGAVRQRQPEAAEGSWRRLRCGRHVPAYAVRSVLRRARQDGARPVLRRCRARPHRLHPLRRLHDRMPRRRQEHVDEELPVVRGEEGSGDHPRATGGRHPAARCGRWHATDTS